MAFSDTDISYIAGLYPVIEYTLKVKTNKEKDFTEVNLVESGFNLERSISSVSSSLSFLTAIRDTDFSIGSQIELWAHLGNNAVQARIFAGFIIEQSQEFPIVSNTALDLTELFRRSCAQIFSQQLAVLAINNASLVQVISAGEGLWGLDASLNPNGFETNGSRRAWALAPVVISDGTTVLPPDSYYTDFSSGLVRIYMQVNNPVLEYCRPLVAGTNDIADILTSLLAYPASDLGPNIETQRLQFDKTGVDLPQAIWHKHSGSVLDAWVQLKRELSDDWFLAYRADTDRYILTTLSATDKHRFKLPSIIKTSQKQNISSYATDVVTTGILDRPVNFACAAIVSDLQESTGDLIRWNGSARDINPGESNLKQRWVDADPNTGFGHSSVSFSAGSWYELAKIDLGTEQFIGGIRITAGNSLNPNALKQDDRNLLPAYKLFGSSDDVDYYPLSAQQPIECLPIETVTISSVLLPKLRYVKVYCRAYCDTNNSTPAVTLNEIGIFEMSAFAAFSQAQKDNEKLPNFYPEQLNEHSLYGRSVIIEQTDTRYGQIAAQKLADKILESYINPTPKIYITTISNPLIELGDTVWLDDINLDYHGRVLVERISLSPALCKIVARAIDFGVNNE